jgi:predicted Zn finger-like uncharacterized protein
MDPSFPSAAPNAASLLNHFGIFRGEVVWDGVLHTKWSSMDVTCPACAARYVADGEKLRGKTTRMRCRACDTVWLVAGPGSTDDTGNTKRAAIVKRGAEREHRDLFASPQSMPAPLSPHSSSFDQGPRSTLRAPPDSRRAPTAVAARNETSVLFTVDALRGVARVKTPDPEPSPISTAYVAEDDGIIDLNALSSPQPNVQPKPHAMFGSEPPPGFATDVMDVGHSARKGPSKRVLVGVAAAASALLLGAFGLHAAFKGEEPAVQNAAPLAMVASATPTPVTPVVVAQPSAAVATPPVATPEPSAAVTTGTTRKGHGKKSSGKHAPGAKGTHTAAAIVGATPQAPKPVAKAADKCGCKGDFNCILRCSATGK